MHNNKNTCIVSLNTFNINLVCYSYSVSMFFMKSPLCRALVHPTKVLCQKNPICLRCGQKGCGEDKTGVKVGVKLHILPHVM